MKKLLKAWRRVKLDKEARELRANQYSTLLYEIQRLKDENARLKAEQSNVRKSWLARIVGN